MDLKNDMKPNAFVTQGKTKVVNASILSPELGNLRLLVVPCGESGKPETDLHALLNKKWRPVAAELKGWYANHINFKLGNVKTTAVQSDTWVVHSLCLTKEGALDEKALAGCVKKLADMAKYEKGSVHVSTLTTTAYPLLVQLLQEQCINKGIAVYFYEEPEATK
jgi:hypothetical protein